MNLIKKGSAWICSRCNSDELDFTDIFIDDFEDEGHMFIECPGATIYADGTEDIVAGVKFLNDDDPTRGHEIIDHPVFAPTHKKRRRIKHEAFGRIRRCQGCQDYTVRMRRREGPDFYIPSVRHPKRKKLKSVSPTTNPS